MRKGGSLVGMLSMNSKQLSKNSMPPSPFQTVKHPNKITEVALKENVENPTHSVERVRGLDDVTRSALLQAGRATAEANAWSRQGPLWQDFFAGVVE